MTTVAGSFRAGAVLLFGLQLACASTPGHGPEIPAPRLADGMEVPAEAEFLPPKPLESFQPELGSTAGYRGLVEVDALIDEKGFVRDVRPVSSTNDRLLERVVSRVNQTPFRPATLDGEPVAVLYRITVRVVMQ